ncbi:MAG TPA: hypothetical protein VFN13_11475, partial [Rudaea sp.]|nr:hypothetical protein [Rudaea sp.]
EGLETGELDLVEAHEVGAEGGSAAARRTQVLDYAKKRRQIRPAPRAAMITSHPAGTRYETRY